MTKQTRFQTVLYLMLLIVVLLGISFFVLVYEQTKYQQALESRALSLKLVEELLFAAPHQILQFLIPLYE